jgi:hypothetical protein
MMKTLQFRNKRQKPDPPVADLERRQLQAYAAAVRDEQHWQDILASAPSEETRHELERIIGPMLAFRRAAACTTPGCESGKVGTWQPVLELRNPFSPDPIAWVPIELHLCDECKAEATVKDFLTPDVWSQILAQWDNDYGPPVHHRTTLIFDRVH